MNSEFKDDRVFFRQEFQSMLLAHGFIYKYNKFVRVFPGHGAIFIYFEKYRRIPDIKVSVVSFSNDIDDLNNIINTNAISIWTFRNIAINEAFDPRSNKMFVETSKSIIEKYVLPELIKIHNAEDILRYHTTFTDKLSRSDMHFIKNKLAAALQIGEYDYIMNKLDEMRIDITNYVVRMKESNNMYIDHAIERYNEVIENISQIQNLIVNDHSSLLEKYLQERNDYWDGLCKQRYPKFYKGNNA